MQVTEEHNQRVAKLSFSSVYPALLAKVQRKGRTQAELDEVIEWLTGYTAAETAKLVARGTSYQEFFAHARLNPNASLIKGTICGYKIEEIENELTCQVRYLDKLVDELAKGKAMDKILRKPA
ncbi:DUF2200 domain-containing protein [Pelobium manganitolerans]|uniref:DUF2200 domain-containing protein n=1 Tax=Pelobium manganitolerans TaxID=1842495 RepID=UPI003FA358B2